MPFPPLVTNASSISVLRAVLAFVCNSTPRSEMSLIYTGIDANGDPILNSSKTVHITVESIRDQLFLTWQESDGTTVVHLEDYKMKTSIKNIPQPGSGAKASPDFSKSQGRIRQVS
jgi:hypothetical protein